MVAAGRGASGKLDDEKSWASAWLNSIEHSMKAAGIFQICARKQFKQTFPRVREWGSALFRFLTAPALPTLIDSA